MCRLRQLEALVREAYFETMQLRWWSACPQQFLLCLTRNRQGQAVYCRKEGVLRSCSQHWSLTCRLQSSHCAAFSGRCQTCNVTAEKKQTSKQNNSNHKNPNMLWTRIQTPLTGLMQRLQRSTPNPKHIKAINSHFRWSHIVLFSFPPF